MKEFIKYDDMWDELYAILKPVWEQYDEAVRSQVDIDDYVDYLATEFVEDMDEYVHGDTDIPGNLMDIAVNWNLDNKDIGFRDVIAHIDVYYRLIDDNDAMEAADSQEEALLKRFQDYALNWFFEAFGIYNIKYNFGTMMGELEYEYEEELKSENK